MLGNTKKVMPPEARYYVQLDEKGMYTLKDSLAGDINVVRFITLDMATMVAKGLNIDYLELLSKKAALGVSNAS